MIQEVQLLVSELRRITILWDELWLGTLNQHSANINKLITQLDHEVEKVEKNDMLNEEQKKTIIREKHKTVLKPVCRKKYCFLFVAQQCCILFIEESKKTLGLHNIESTDLSPSAKESGFS